MNLILFEEYELGKSLPRGDERTVHLLKVLRKRPGDSFEAGVLGRGRGTGRVEKIGLDGSLFVSLRIDGESPPRHPLRVAVGFSRPIQIRRLLRDLSNLGTGAIDLVGTDLGEKSYQDTKLMRDGGAHAALIEGAAQSRDTTIPALAVFPTLDAWLDERPWDAEAEAQSRGTGLSAGPRTVPLLVAADNVRPEGAMARISPTRRPVVLAIGSERGWTDREREALEAAGFTRLSLGGRALRTETACVAAAVLALEKIGEMD
ncbi:MAG: 16S rRNA (uracil(1498)-N(3))-methyltransferase [Treponema sp.]|jgi:RsmE family RNA methyltransferase|nr:16S rRNA (uracil(1498)-N(3))-methyltransferase [Treponema sp.]